MPDPCGENANCKVQKSLRITDMQLLQGIVRGQPDCKCKEGCKGDPFKKCDCDLPNPANETQADPGNSCTATIPLLALAATKIGELDKHASCSFFLRNRAGESASAWQRH